MSFWEKIYFLIQNVKTNLKASLRACHKQIDPNTSDISNNPKNIKNSIPKRTFFLTPSEYKASMCLEATLSFSFFLIFFVNILSIIFLFMIYAKDLAALHQHGKKIAAYAYVTDVVWDSKEENIKLQKNRVVESPFSLLSLPGCRLYTQCVVKPWTGYDVTKRKNRMEENSVVYMTEYGSVYHKNRSCTHLALSIQSIASTRVSEKRNENGECYYSCEYCGDYGLVTVVFVTSYGNRYHTTTKCKGLKRNVKSMPLSEVEGVNPCKKCG